MLESEAAVQHSLYIDAQKRQRAAQVNTENEEWAKAHGFDPAEMEFMFA